MKNYTKDELEELKNRIDAFFAIILEGHPGPYDESGEYVLCIIADYLDQEGWTWESSKYDRRFINR